MKSGILIFLNGTSSSGKTSISTELIHQKEVPFHHLSIDNFFSHYNHFINAQLPEKTPNEIDDALVSHILDDSIISLYNSTIKLMLAFGLNVIADTVIDNDQRFNDFLDSFSNQSVLFVGVLCSKEELTKRERARGDRQIGLVDSQFNKVYCFNKYDLEVHTEFESPAQCAEKISIFIKSNSAYSVFKNLHKRTISNS